MKKEEIAILANILSSMKESIKKIEEAQKNNDAKQLAIAKKEMLEYQKRFNDLL